MSDTNSTPVEVLQATADAIRGKTGGTSVLFPHEFPNEIDSISQGSSVVEKDVNFYTPYGTLCDSLTMEELRTAKELPSAPELDRLVFQEWNWTLDEIKGRNYPVNVGGIYTTESGKTEIDLTITPNLSRSITFWVYKVTEHEFMHVDWGDGTSLTGTSLYAGVKTLTHTYEQPGKYTVEIGNGVDAYRLTSNQTTNNFTNMVSDYRITEIRMGTNCVGVEGATFRQLFSLEAITFSENVIKVGTVSTVMNSLHSCIGYAFPRGWIDFHLNYITNNYSLQFCIFPATTLALYNGMLSGRNLLAFSFPTGIATIPASFLSTNYLMGPRLFVPSNVVSIAANAFNNCFGIREYIMIPITPPVLANVNAFTGINQFCKIKVPKGSLEAYKAATNWDTYANQIFEMTDEEMLHYGLAVKG